MSDYWCLKSMILPTNASLGGIILGSSQVWCRNRCVGLSSTSVSSVVTVSILFRLRTFLNSSGYECWTHQFPAFLDPIFDPSWLLDRCFTLKWARRHATRDCQIILADEFWMSSESLMLRTRVSTGLWHQESICIWPRDANVTRRCVQTLYGFVIIGLLYYHVLIGLLL